MNKFGSCDKNLMNTLNIKSEIEVKNKSLETYKEYLIKNVIKSELVKDQNKVSVFCTDGLHLEKPCGSNFGKIEVQHEDTFNEVYDGIVEDNDYDLKTDFDVKKEDIEDRSGNLYNDVLWKGDIADPKGEITNETKMTEIFDSSSPISSTFRNEKHNIIQLKNEERKKEKNKIEEFESHKRIRLNEKFELSLCDNKTTLKKKLHSQRIIHSTVKVFKCSECNFESCHKHGLKMHLLTHSNEKLFKCSECDYRCNHKASLKKHLLLHSTKLFKCPECDYECYDRSNFKKHVLTHSNALFRILI